jgi:hypothetical protein
VSAAEHIGLEWVKIVLAAFTLVSMTGGGLFFLTEFDKRVTLLEQKTIVTPARVQNIETNIELLKQRMDIYAHDQRKLNEKVDNISDKLDAIDSMNYKLDRLLQQNGRHE